MHQLRILSILLIFIVFEWLILNLRRNPPDVRVTSGQKPSTKIIYIVLQTSVGLF